MGLSREEIDRLLALPEHGGRARKPGTNFSDPTSRTSENWFTLMHKLFDTDTNDLAVCSNENCIDPRDKSRGQVTAEISPDIWICRHCFLGGYATVTDGQLVI